MSTCVQPDSIFPIHILGSGSIGFLFASGLQKVRSDGVTMLLRRHNKSRLNTHSTSSTKCFAPVQVCRPSDMQIIRKCDIPAEIIGDATNQYPIKCLLVCTKANDAIPAIKSVWKRLDLQNNSKIIILSNGALAISDSIQSHFGCEHVQIITATTTHGAYADQTLYNESDFSGYCIVHAGDGLTYCTNREFIDTCQDVGWKGSDLSEFDMNMMLWKKLAANCVINPLTAIHGVRNGQLLSLESTDQTMAQILEELSSVAIAELDAFVQAKEDNEAKGHAQRSIRKEFSVDYLKSFVTKVMNDTSDNISSMLQDVNAKRTTEVRFLNGYVARIGKEKYGIDCQWNEDMCNKVEDLKH